MSQKTYNRPFTESQVDGTQPANQYRYIIYPLVTGYKWARYLSDGSTKLQFVNHVYSTSSSAYPNGGVKNGYYYERVFTQDNLIPNKKNDANDDGRVGYTVRTSQISIPQETRYRDSSTTTSDTVRIPNANYAGVFSKVTNSFYYVNSSMQIIVRPLDSTSTTRLTTLATELTSTYPNLNIVKHKTTGHEILTALCHYSQSEDSSGNRSYTFWGYDLNTKSVLFNKRFSAPGSYQLAPNHYASVSLSPRCIIIANDYWLIIDQYFIINGAISTTHAAYIENPFFQYQSGIYFYEDLPLSVGNSFYVIATQYNILANDPYRLHYLSGTRRLLLFSASLSYVRNYVISPNNTSLYCGIFDFEVISSDTCQFWWPGLNPFIADSYSLDDTITLTHYQLNVGTRQLSLVNSDGVIDTNISRDMILSEAAKTDGYDRDGYTKLSFMPTYQGTLSQYTSSPVITIRSDGTVYLRYSFTRYNPTGLSGAAHSMVFYRLDGLSMASGHLVKSSEVSPYSCRSFPPFNQKISSYYDVNYCSDIGFIDGSTWYGIGQYSTYQYLWRRFTKTTQVPYTVTMGTAQEMYYKSNPNNSLDKWTGSKPSQICYVRADQYDETQEKKHMGH